VSTKDDLHHLLDELDEAAADEVLKYTQRLSDEKNERLAEEERARLAHDELVVTQNQDETNHGASSTGTTGTAPLRIDSFTNTPLSGALKGCTSLELLNAILKVGDNITVGLLAQAIVGHVLCGLGAKIMPTYYSWDLEIPHAGSFARVEIKTCSTTQSWPPHTWRDPKNWGCGPIASMWDPGREKFVIQQTPYRPAHMYIFVRRDGDVFNPTSYRARAFTTNELVLLRSGVIFVTAP
jgi:hypothetical protein